MYLDSVIYKLPKVELSAEATSADALTELEQTAAKVNAVLKDHQTPTQQDLTALGKSLARAHHVLKEEAQKEGVIAKICHFFARFFGLESDPEVELNKGFQTLMLANVAQKRRQYLTKARKLVLQGKREIERRSGQKLEVSDRELVEATVIAHVIHAEAPFDKPCFLFPDVIEKFAGIKTKRTLYRDKTGIYLVYNQNKRGPRDPYVGRGAIKDVKFGHNLLTGETIARQTIKIKDDPDNIAHADNDITNLKRFANQPGQVKVITYSPLFFSEKKKIHKMHVYMPLYEKLNRGNINKLNLSPLQKLNMLMQMAQAVAFIHGQGRGHGDIKPDNFLLDDQGNICLNDYGAVFIPGTVSEACTAGYAPPEVNEEDRPGKKPRTRKLSADIYSLGLTFEGLFQDIVYTNENMRRLTDAMMAYDRRDRPKLAQVMATLQQEIAREKVSTVSQQLL